MQLTALVERAGHVCCRYRLEAMRPFLEEAGHCLETRPWPRRWWQWLREARALRRSDVVIVQRRLPHPALTKVLRRTIGRLVFDFDDAIFLHDSYDPRGLHCPTRLRHFAALCGAADLVVAGNAFLAAQAARWTDTKTVHVIPTCVEPARYPLAPHRRAGRGVELVWIGSASTLQGLRQVSGLLEELGRASPGVSLRLVCDQFLELRELPIVRCPWSEASEAEALAAADIGISWVPDDLWSRGKCGLKVLQYMAAGLPVVANPVGVQAELIRHGETGFLAESEREWCDAVSRLAGDSGLRRRLGQAGRQRVVREFAVAVGAARWLHLLAGLSDRRDYTHADNCFLTEDSCYAKHAGSNLS